MPQCHFLVVMVCQVVVRVDWRSGPVFGSLENLVENTVEYRARRWDETEEQVPTDGENEQHAHNLAINFAGRMHSAIFLETDHPCQEYNFYPGCDDLAQVSHRKLNRILAAKSLPYDMTPGTPWSL